MDKYVQNLYKKPNYLPQQKDLPLSGTDSLFGMFIPFKGIYNFIQDFNKRKQKLIPRGGNGLKSNLSYLDFVQQKIDSIRSSALEKSRTRKNSEELRLPLLDYEKESIYDGIRSYLRSFERSYSDPLLAQKYYNIAQNELTKLYKGNIAALNCIYTATDNFGKRYRVSGNQTFKANPSKYGFKKINNEQLQEGDLVQDIKFGTPVHALIYNGKDANGAKTFNYSPGTYPEYKVNSHYPFEYDSQTYRFVGTPQDSIQWKKEYDLLNQ